MLKISRVVIISILIVTQWTVWGQNNTNSPYTRFGYGELADRSFGAGRGMGGVGYGLRSSRNINPMNPASYSGIDSLTFLFDFGASVQMSWFDDGTNKQRDTNGNLEYLALQFPITRWLAMSAGMLPYSYVGYQFGSYVDSGDAPYEEQFIGAGGLNELYGGLSIDIWKKRLSVGANIGYLFGDVSHQRNVLFTSSTSSGTNNVYKTNTLRVRDMKYDFGVQYTHPIGRDQWVTAGAVYSPSIQMNTKVYDTEIVGSSQIETAVVDTILSQRFDIPTTYGFGLSYVKNNKLTVAADVKYEEWDQAHYFDKKGDFQNRIRVGGGVEYIPNYSKRNIFNRIRYRAGLHYSNSYLKMNSVTENGKTGFGYDEFGASVGLGFPLIDLRSYVNVTFEYVKVEPEAKMMIDEQYFRLTVNLSFNERWFAKLKLK